MPDVGNFGTIVSLIVLMVTWMIVQPLKQSILTLTQSIERLRDTVDDNKKEVNHLRERVAKAESNIGSAHRRIDELISTLNDKEGK